MMLSDRRAAAVKQYLVDKYSIDLKRLKTEAHGENNPMMEGKSDEARQQNRRVEFMLSME